MRICRTRDISNLKIGLFEKTSRLKQTQKAMGLKEAGLV